MIDVAEEAKNNIEYQVTLSKVKEWEKKYGDIPKEAAVIFNFGWHKKFHNKTEYIDTETGNWDLIRHPSVSKEVGDYLYDQRNIKIIGTDTMTPDPVTLNGKKVDSMPIHQMYLPNNKLIVENLNATDSLPARGFRFHAAPVKYLGPSGAQVRAYAVLYENTFELCVVRMKGSYALIGILVLVNVEARLIDLSHEHGPNAIMSVLQPHYNWTRVFQGEFLPGMYAETGAYFTGEHGGTHVDVPAHFSPGGMRLEKVPLEMTIAEGVMIDCSYEASRNHSYLVSIQKILDWEATNGRIPDNAAVLFNFGWSQYYSSFERYLGTPNDIITEFVFPAISKEAGMFLYDQRNIKIIGSDTASPDPYDPTGLHIHMKYLPNNRLIIEDLNDLGLLPPRGFRFHASPVKYVGATGAQVRAYAMTYDTRELEFGFSGARTDVSAVTLIVFLLALKFSV
ncbi:hypothetical protein Btru_022878 [Bulinus truncatus]|nr:hypothetical protein Btru_022878 [Bulinus truncatus]